MWRCAELAAGRLSALRDGLVRQGLEAARRRRASGVCGAATLGVHHPGPLRGATRVASLSGRRHRPTFGAAARPWPMGRGVRRPHAAARGAARCALASPAHVAGRRRESDAHAGPGARGRGASRGGPAGEARRALTEHAAEYRRWRVRHKASQGGNTAPQRALHTLQGIAVADGEIERDTGRVVALVLGHSAHKWGAHSEEGQARVVAALDALSPDPPAWTDREVVEAFLAVRRPERVDAEGISPSAAAIVAAAVPEIAGAAVRGLAGCASRMQKSTVHAVPWGKRTATPALAKIRALLPLGTIMTVVDVILACSLHAVCDARAVPAGFWECAVSGPARSASHLAHASRLLIEKGLDTGSSFALLQTDIATFYGKIDVVRAAQVAVSDGLRREDAAAAVRHQLLARVSFRVPGAEAKVLGRRTTGALTGSRTAGALGRFVVHELAAHVCRVRASSALVLPPSPPILVATYVDNIVIVGGDCSNVEATYAECERYLELAWGLHLPLESTSVVLPRGARVGVGRVARVEGVSLLGSWLDERATSLSCWRRARDTALASAQAQMRRCRRAFVPLRVRLRVLESTVLPQIMSRAPAWAPSLQLLSEVDRFQRRCVTAALAVPAYPGEDGAAYRRRRGRMASEAVADQDRWSRKVLLSATTRLRELREEISRGPERRESWTASLLAYRDAAWLAERRVAEGSGSTSAGRVGVRAAAGRTAPRYEESVLRAAECA